MLLFLSKIRTDDVNERADVPGLPFRDIPKRFALFFGDMILYLGMAARAAKAGRWLQSERTMPKAAFSS